MTLRAQIAFDLSLTTGVNFFTLDDVDKGVLDNTEYVLGGDALIDVTEYLRSVQVDRGRSRTLEKFTPGRRTSASTTGRGSSTRRMGRAVLRADPPEEATRPRC
jgi:hypothetical protein